MEEELSHVFISGKRTAQNLKAKGIISPELKQLIKLDQRTYIEKPVKLKDEELEQWIRTKKYLLKIK